MNIKIELDGRIFSGSVEEVVAANPASEVAPVEPEAPAEPSVEAPAE